jgi:hypothetical protein
MALPIIPIAIAAIAAGLKFGGKAIKAIQASRAAKKEMQMGQQMTAEAQRLSEAFPRPEMQVPQAIQQQMRGLQGLQYQQMPGMTMAQNQISQATAGGVEALERMGTGAEAYGGIADLYGQQMGQQRGLAQQQALYQGGGQEKYLEGLGGLGQWEQQAWQWNEAQPYVQAQQKASQMETQGRESEWQGLQTKMGAQGELFGGALESAGGLMGQMGGAGLFGGGPSPGAISVDPQIMQRTQMPTGGGAYQNNLGQVLGQRG